MKVGPTLMISFQVNYIYRDPIYTWITRHLQYFIKHESNVLQVETELHILHFVSRPAIFSHDTGQWQ